MAEYTYEELLKQQKDALAASKAKKIQATAEVHNKQREQAAASYEQQVRETEASYDDLSRQNAVQRLINEREVAESMANLGLTDSGLSKTQQTAVQLSYSNAKKDIDLQRRKVVDALTQQLASSLANIDMQETASVAEVEEAYENAAVENAASVYKSQQEAQYEYLTEIAKLAADTPTQNIINTDDGILSRGYSGKLSDNGVRVVKDADGNVTYIDTKTGRRSKFSAGVNPYTDTVNKDLLDEDGRYDITKAFSSNGYQPNNIGGQVLKKYTSKIGGIDVPMTTIVNGDEQAIWMTPDGTKYVWRGDLNRYVPWAENSVNSPRNTGMPTITPNSLGGTKTLRTALKQANN